MKSFAFACAPVAYVLVSLALFVAVYAVVRGFGALTRSLRGARGRR